MLAVLMMAAAMTGPGEVDKLGWMAGSWVQEKDGVVVREAWLSPRDGAMAGVGQTTRPGKPPLIEHMKITTEAAGPTFTAILPKQGPTPFVLISARDGEVVFENKTHDFPQRVIYRRCGADLCGRIEGTVNGKLASEDWRYIRAK